MQKIIDYELAVAGALDEIEESVKRKLLLGWQPIGGICVSLDGTEESAEEWYYQAMVKYE